MTIIIMKHLRTHQIVHIVGGDFHEAAVLAAMGAIFISCSVWACQPALPTTPVIPLDQNLVALKYEQGFNRGNAPITHTQYVKTQEYYEGYKLGMRTAAARDAARAPTPIDIPHATVV